jgi:serine/threonine-protein kinase
MPLSNGATFAGFRIVRLLGSGGMGEVYLAQHPRLPKHNALKILPAASSSDIEFQGRFEREADLAASLYHPHIVGVHDRGEADGQLWIAMDYVDGADASRLLANKYPAGMALDQVLAIVSAVASALDYAHRRGMLHRDVKPANIILTDDDGGEQRILLADFGIARNVDDISGLTATNMTVGTVAYAAPEQLMGEAIDGRADQYALAATAYHLLTGSQLFPHSNPAVVISRHLNAPVPALADRRPELHSLDPILAAALAKNPNDRFASCTDFARAVTEATSPQTLRSAAAPTTPNPTARSPHVSPTSPNAVRWLIVVSIAVVLLLGVVGVLWRPWQHPQSNATASSSSDSSTTATPTVIRTPAPLPAAPPPVTVTALPPTSAAQVPTGPTVGDQCNDWMKISIDATTEQEMICSGYPDDYPKMTWYSSGSTLVGGMADAPRVGRTGSPCNVPPFTFGRSSDGYSVWCFGGGTALMPGGKSLSVPNESPVWALYSP